MARQDEGSQLSTLLRGIWHRRGLSAAIRAGVFGQPGQQAPALRVVGGYRPRNADEPYWAARGYFGPVGGDFAPVQLWEAPGSRRFRARARHHVWLLPQARPAPLAQSAERLHGKEKVYGSIP